MFGRQRGASDVECVLAAWLFVFGGEMVGKLGAIDQDLDGRGRLKVVFQLLNRERIRPKTYGSREEAEKDVFDYIEMFYNQSAGTVSSMIYRR